MPNMHQYLEQLHKSDLYPFHIPGHKRRAELFDEEEEAAISGAYTIDFTETPLTDDLFEPNGIIREVKDKTNRLYSDTRGDLETHILVNGATAGVMTAVSALLNEDDTIIVARNSHRSLYHALYLNHLHAVYVQPGVSEAYGFAGPVSPDDVARAIAIAPDAKAIFITSPTYEGVLSDVALIAVIAHSHNIPLIVDESHGAHLGLYPMLPRSALQQGADVVIHSAHKTLAGMSQTAFLHVQGTLVNRDRIARFLRIYQTSSPSFVLMSSIDTAVSDLSVKSVMRFETLLGYKNMILTDCAAMRVLRIADETIVNDPCKVVVLSDYITGNALADILRTEYRIEVEMARDTHVVLVVTPYDTIEGIDRLIYALLTIDAQLTASGETIVSPINRSPLPALTSAFLSISDAWDAPFEEVSLAEATGLISADFIYAYPPGIPLIVPGEEFSSEMCAYLTSRITSQTLRGVSLSGTVRCVLA